MTFMLDVTATLDCGCNGAPATGASELSAAAVAACAAVVAVAFIAPPLAEATAARAAVEAA